MQENTTEPCKEDMLMEQYIGVKIIKAKPMSKHEYNAAHNRTIAGDECDGYLVHYQNAHGEFEENGYFSWSPKDVFEEAYRKTDGLTYGLAVEAKKKGLHVARHGWNGKGMFVRFVSETPELNAHFEIFNTRETFDTWVPSVSDILGEDWYIVK
jgi:hypothetical protein